MKKKTKIHENYPVEIVVLCVFFNVLILGIGFSILWVWGSVFAFLYLLYFIWLKYELLKGSCVHCYYYNKFCAIGHGKLCGMFFKKGNNKKFNQRKITWKMLMPDMLLFFIPLLAGIIKLIIHFRLDLFIFVIIFIILNTIGNAWMHGEYICKYCKQRILGCPAEQLFNKTKKKK